MKDNDKASLAYENLASAAKFREQYRFIFTGAIVATFFVVPFSDALEIVLKITLGFSAFFAALYLIATAATVKYKDHHTIYEVFYISERSRKRMYDFAVDVFGFAFLVVIGTLIVGLVEKIFAIKIVDPFSYMAVGVATLLVALLIAIINNYLHKRKRKSSNEDELAI